MTTTPAAFSAFLRDVVDASTRHQTTVAEQVPGDGFVVWCADAARADGMSSPFFERPTSDTTTFLRVERPGPPPRRTAPPNEPDSAYDAAQRQWTAHKVVYDELFGARTPGEGVELVAATGLLTTHKDGHHYDRHLAAAAAEVAIDVQTQALIVTLVDTPVREVTWLDPEIRRRLTSSDTILANVFDAQSLEALEAALRSASVELGTDAQLRTRRDEPLHQGAVALTPEPAVMLRTKDTSALLQLLTDMAADIADDGFVSEPLNMLLDTRYVPTPLSVDDRSPALPLPANGEQRQMIDRARTDRHMVVQGPPGTGKTHTIANLASVLMAEGRRVLVTAENDRALGEVQGKLPKRMQPLMLPMLQDGATAALGRSVNGLLGVAGRPGNRARLAREEEDLRARLDKLAERTSEAESDLVAVSDADREERRVGGDSLRLSGHLLNLSQNQTRVDRVVRYLSEGVADAADGRILVDLTLQVDAADTALMRFSLPVGLDDPHEFDRRIGDFRAEMGVLGDLRSRDASELVKRREDLLRLADRLDGFPAVPWSQIVESPLAFRQHAEACGTAAGDLDHGIAVVGKSNPAAAIAALAAFVGVASDRAEVSISQLIERFDRARDQVEGATEHGRVRSPEYCDDLTEAAEDALRLLDHDRSGVLEQHVNDVLQAGTSSIDLLAEEAGQFLERARAPSGLPVIIAEAAPPPHELLDAADGLLAHLRGGGKMSRLVGTPKPIKAAEVLLQHVTVAGSVIDTVEEAERVVEHLAHLRQCQVIDSWADQHDLRIPDGVSRYDWVKSISAIREASAEIVKTVRFSTEWIDFPPPVTNGSARRILDAATATVAAHHVEELGGFGSAWHQFGGEIRRDGHPVDNYTDAVLALQALRAEVQRRESLRLLPALWQSSIDSSQVVGTDRLVDALRQAGTAASIPGPLRDSQLAPSTVRRLADRATTDFRRRELRGQQDGYLSRLERIANGCVPASPATRKVAEAINDTDTAAYRGAVGLLDDERLRQDRARRLEGARERLADAHPDLVASFDAGEADATIVLRALDAYQNFAAYRWEILKWSREMGTTATIHERLKGLHSETREFEGRLASNRAWAAAVGRITGHRSAEASLSRLTIAVDKVPKTRTAKSYPRSIREVRDATREAAPSIPCWVMPIDRIAEVLGYPVGGDRFDVVIVDEASQAWFPAVFLYAIADQVIVVGDDLQTSPSGSTVTEAEMQVIVRQHIPDHQLANQAGGDLSLYDVAASMSGPTAMTDHFRCVPEIIALSNLLSYEPKGKKLLPSRVRMPGALTPIRHVRVVGSGRSRSAEANQPEVDAVVEQVIACHTDSEYRGKTFGVVVVGPRSMAHLKALRSALLETLGATALHERELEIGTSAQFQGAERDVMFLSLVEHAGPGERIRRWPHEHTGRNRRNVQRLNVAVSRARDQLWIFRSFDKSALPPGDARAVLLDEVPDADTDLTEQLLRCDSKFESDVVKSLAGVDATLQIRTQVEAIGYSIDIVLEDVDGNRLAVECDGDRWHTSTTQIRNDLYRQRTLESIGWRFHRFLASEWYADVDGHVRGVLDALAPPELPEAWVPGSDLPEQWNEEETTGEPVAVIARASAPNGVGGQKLGVEADDIALAAQANPSDDGNPGPRAFTGMPSATNSLPGPDTEQDVEKRPDEQQLFAAVVMAGITREHLAENAGVTVQTVRHWVTEAGIPSLGRGNHHARQLPHAFLELAVGDFSRAKELWPHTGAFPSTYVKDSVEWWRKHRDDGRHPGLPSGLGWPTDRPQPRRKSSSG